MEKGTGYRIEMSPELESLFAEAESILAEAREQMSSAIDWANGELGKRGIGPLRIVLSLTMPEVAEAAIAAGAITEAAEGSVEALEDLSDAEVEGFARSIAGLVGATSGPMVAKRVIRPREGDPNA